MKILPNYVHKNKGIAGTLAILTVLSVAMIGATIYSNDFLHNKLGEVLQSQDPLKAFPGAEGFGTDTPGGRGGTVIKVTNLNNSGAGSLRAALEASGPRIVVFDVAGVIQLDERIEITEPFITIAGQTAPGDGIAIKGSPIDIQTHDVIIRGLRLRIGDGSGDPPGSRDGITLGPPWSNPGNVEVYNVVIDHCSISWAIDENISSAPDGSGTSGQIYDITISNSIISEALDDSIHPRD